LRAKYLSICSWQFGLFSPSESSFTPESCTSLLLRSSSLRRQFEDWRDDDKLSQHRLVRLQHVNLIWKNKTEVYTETFANLEVNRQ